MSDDQPRQYTVEEQQKMLLDHLRGLIRYWENESRTPSVHGKLEGLVFSILVMFDGCSGDMPGFDLVSRTDPGDPEYLRSEGSNWWPTHEHLDEVDGYEPLNGGLHDMFCAKEREARKNGTYREPQPTNEEVDVNETATAIAEECRNLLISFANRARAAEAKRWSERQTTAMHSHMLAALSPDAMAMTAAREIERLTMERDAALAALHRLKET